MENQVSTVSNYVFETAFGWCSVTTSGESVSKVVLPGIYNSAELHNDGTYSTAIDEFSRDVIRRICDYFDGEEVDFSDIDVTLPFGSEFSYKILRTCRQIPYGQVISYKDLAAEAGFQKSIRAAANILARNPLPLIIPCHRVIRANGKSGGFMKNIEGAAVIKQKMLELEKTKKQKG